MRRSEAFVTRHRLSRPRTGSHRSSSPPAHAPAWPKRPTPNAWAPPRAPSRVSRTPGNTRRPLEHCNATPEPSGYELTIELAPRGPWHGTRSLGRIPSRSG